LYFPKNATVGDRKINFDAFYQHGRWMKKNAVCTLVLLGIKYKNAAGFLSLSSFSAIGRGGIWSFYIFHGTMLIYSGQRPIRQPLRAHIHFRSPCIY
jgi:hypothetical protein